MNLIRWFHDTRITDRPTVGGKCAGLGELIAAGVEVPPGFAVTVEAFDALGRRGRLGAELAALNGTDATDPAALAEAHRRAIALIGDAPLPGDLAEQLDEAYERLCRLLGQPPGRTDLPVAVRSSAVAEDGGTASFAGQQETFLWTVGPADVRRRLRECWASLFTPQAIAYRARLSAEHAEQAGRIAVGVQAMVDAEVAGVALTVSPSTGDRSLVGINASWGLGQAVVSGEVTPDEYWVSKVDFSERSRVVAAKARECRPDPSGRGVVMLDVAPERRDRPCLEPAQVRLVADMAVRVEQHAGTPQDIEWAIARSPGGTGALMVLQARPETTWSARLAEHAARAATTGGGYLALIHAAGTGTVGGPGG